MRNCCIVNLEDSKVTRAELERYVTSTRNELQKLLETNVAPALGLCKFIHLVNIFENLSQV